MSCVSAYLDVDIEENLSACILDVSLAGRLSANACDLRGMIKMQRVFRSSRAMYLGQQRCIVLKNLLLPSLNVCRIRL